MALHLADITSSSDFLTLLCFFLSSYWSKFHVNIITGSGVMTIFFYKGLTRNPEIGKNPVCVLHNISRLGQVRDTKFDMSVSNIILLNAAKYQGNNFYCFWVIKGKPVGGKITPSPPPRPRLGLILFQTLLLRLHLKIFVNVTWLFNHTKMCAYKVLSQFFQ